MPSFDKTRLLRNATSAQLDEFSQKITAILENAESSNQKWLEEHHFPPDITRSVRVAMADVFGDFVTADEIEGYAMNKIWELLQTAADRRQWLANMKPPGKRSVETPWTEDEETEARRLINAGKAKTANVLRELLSMNRSAAQSLFRKITGKQKKKHRIE